MSNEAEIREHARYVPARKSSSDFSCDYILAGESTPGWQVRGPASWNNLSNEAKEINLITIDVWVKNEKLVDAGSMPLTRSEK